MTDSLKFGPEWLRNLKGGDTMLMSGGGGNGGGGVSGSGAAMVTQAPPLKLAEFRYGREEMLALFDRAILPPDPLRQMQGLYVDKTQPPLALLQMTDEETRMWNRGINSDVALRLSKPGPGGPGAGTGVGGRGAMGGRGGSVDRGRGRARGSYHYSRGLSYNEDTAESNGYNPRGMRNYDRSQQNQGGWGERNGGDPGDYNTATSPRKEFGARSLSDTNWRRHRGAGEEDDWRPPTRTDKWGRSNSWRENEGGWERDRERPGNNHSHPPSRKPWEQHPDDSNLPEWAMENPSESGGSFDASGAFHGGSNYSDDEEGEGQSRTEGRSAVSNQIRSSQHKKEPPNISNGTPASQDHGNSGPLRQSQSSSSLSSHPHPHPLTSSASFSGVENHHRTSQHHGPLESKHQSLPQRERLREQAMSKPPPSLSQQPPPSLTQPPKRPAEHVPAHAPPVVEPKSTKTSQEEEIEQRLLDAADEIVSHLMDDEPPPAPPATGTPPTPAPAPTQSMDTMWFYQDPQGNVQGPFQSSEMSEWFTSGYFKGTLLVRRACDERYCTLSELIKLWNGIPFMLDYYKVPPIKNNEAVLPSMDEQNLLLQFRMQQQQLLLQQRQQAVAKLVQSEHFNSLTLEQQQMLAHQAQLEITMQAQAGLMVPPNHPPPPTPAPANSNVLAMIHQLAQFQQLHQQQQQRQSVTVPVSAASVGVSEPPGSSAHVDPVTQLMQQMGLQPPVPAPVPASAHTPEDQRPIEQFMNAFRQRQAQPPQTQPTMESVWGGVSANTAPAFPGWAPPPGHPTPNHSHTPPQSLWADPTPKAIKTEQEILEEQLCAQEEKKKEELRKQEEFQRLQQEEEERERERQRRLNEEEEMENKRREEEERERERERKRMQEEEDRKRKEAAAAKKAEQDRLRKEEDKKRKEEEKRKKEDEKRKLEEDKKKAEEEKKRIEEERKKREEMAKKQNEALKRLQEQQQQQAAVRAVKPSPAPWTTPDTSGASLADIQKTERKQQQQLREQQEMLRVYQERHQQEQQQQLRASKSGSSLNLKWAEQTSKQQPARVKSLSEIQAEEQQRLSKQAEKEKAERLVAAKEVVPATPGSIWATAPQTLSWSSQQPSVWGTQPTAVNASGPRFWDEVSPKAAAVAKPVKPVTASQQPPLPVKSQAKTKAKKEEASVMKLFEKKIPKTSKSDEFNKWCTKSLSAYAYQVDIPTFVDFLLAFESHKEVREYIRMYLGETKEANDFALEFIDRRARLNSDQPCMPATTPAAPAHSNHFQEVKGKNKKVKKSKMTKVDSRILGFNVTANPDRINVGDRDYGEGL